MSSRRCGIVNFASVDIDAIVSEVVFASGHENASVLEHGGGIVGWSIGAICQLGPCAVDITSKLVGAQLEPVSTSHLLHKNRAIGQYIMWFAVKVG